jgi:two-component system cell cycle sensor histidine kinase/response regulator CckA
LELMNTPLRILHLEDNARDAELIQSALEAESLHCEVVHVKNREEFEKAIEQDRFDVILSDYGLPLYNGFTALNHVREKQPHVPFILLSGTLGEEQAVDSLKNGATDYVLKQRLTRLVPAIRRAVIEAQDRAKRQHAEEQVREQAKLLDKAQDAIFVRDLQNRIVYWNKGSERIYGWTAAEAIGKNANELLSNPAQPNDGRKWVMEEGDWIGEVHQVTKAGQEVLVESRWTVVHDNAGKPKCVLVINTDITKKKRLEAQFLRAQRMESIGALAGGIAHDLNNVLSPILMVADVLQNEFTSKENRHMLEIVKTSAGRGSDMVKQILSFARGVSGEHTNLQIKHLVTDLGKLLQGTFPRSIQIRTEFDKDLCLVKGDATQLHQVLMNLCVNARDAMPDGGSLLIEAANVTLENKATPMQPKPVSGPYVVLTVTDTGQGIPSNLLDKIYEPFFTTKGIGKGTGLGLSTVLGIVKTHSGFIEVSSRVKEGTTFRVYLPASGAATEILPALEKPPAPPMGHGEQILVVDDEFALREITRETLGMFNYQVLTAKDGAEAVTLYHQHHNEIKVVITDMMMPVMDGTATIQALQKIDPRVRIICVSGLSSKPSLSTAIAMNVQASLKKPYSSEKLLTTLRQVIDEDVVMAN